MANACEWSIPKLSIPSLLAYSSELNCSETDLLVSHRICCVVFGKAPGNCSGVLTPKKCY